MKKFGLLLIFDVLLLFGCQFSSNNSVLSEIDSLVIAEKYDSAHKMMCSINLSDMHNEEEVMHFHLLNVQTAYLVNKPLSSSDSLLDVVITYYKQNVNKERLADAYYYKCPSFPDCNFIDSKFENLHPLKSANRMFTWDVRTGFGEAIEKDKSIFIVFCKDDGDDTKGFCEVDTYFYPEGEDIILTDGQKFFKYVDVGGKSGRFRLDFKAGILKFPGIK